MSKPAKSKKSSKDINRYLTEDFSLDDLSDSEDEKPTTSKAAVKTKATKSDENTAPAKKPRKGRSKSEIQQEKIAKEINKIQRELNASKNTKCEQYLYCHCSNAILNLDPQLENQIRLVFKERKIEKQVTFEDMDLAKVYWEKKRVAAELIDDTVNRKETFEPQFGFMIAVDGGSFKIMVNSKQYDEFICDALAAHCEKYMGDIRMTIAVIGNPGINDSKINALNLTLFEKYKVQLRFCRTSEDFSYLIAQMHRTLAKFEKKMETAGTQLHVSVEKGIREGELLVEDWWSRMLNHMYRLPEECRRAIVELYPNPFVFMDRLDQMNPGTAMQHLADIVCDNGRRVGPAIAQKLYLMMTSEDGHEIIDRPNTNA